MPCTRISRRTLFSAAAAAALLSGCGFRLRRQFSLPFETVFLQMDEQASLTYVIRRHLEAETSARVVKEAKDADAILSIVSSSRSRVVHTYNDAGDAREYRLGWDISFRVVSPDGFEYLPPSYISVRRDIPYTIRNYLSRETEEATLYRGMEEDIAVQLMRRIESARQNTNPIRKSKASAVSGKEG